MRRGQRHGAVRAAPRRRRRSARPRPSRACTATRQRAACSRRAGTASCRACSADRAMPLERRLFDLAAGWLAAPTPTRSIPTLWRAVARRPCRGCRRWTTRATHACAMLAARFLHEKTITPVGGSTLDDAPAHACSPRCAACRCSSSAREGLRGWSQLIVYPDAFRVNRSHVDAAGVLHEWEDELIGEAWDAGPVILSWADVQADCEDPRAGFCVAVHEIAHKLDVLDGALDGTPPLAAPLAARMGAATSSAPTTRLCARSRRRPRHRDRRLCRRSAGGILRGRQRIPLQRSGAAARGDAGRWRRT